MFSTKPHTGLSAFIKALFLLLLALSPATMTNAQNDYQTAVSSGYMAFKQMDYDRAWQILGPQASFPAVDDSVRLFYAASIVETRREPLSVAATILPKLEVSAVNRPLLIYYLARIAFLEGMDYQADSLYKLAASLNLNSYYPEARLPYHQQILRDASEIEKISSCLLIPSVSGTFQGRAMVSALQSAFAENVFIPVPESLRSDADRQRHYAAPAFFDSRRSQIYYSSIGSDGNKDFYTSIRDELSQWGLPEKLDSIINSEYDEFALWLTQDADTMYFSSSRAGTMGGLDVFISSRDPVTLLWSSPKNQGMPINSRRDDFLAVPGPSGEPLIILTNRNTGYGLVSMGVYTLDCKGLTTEESGQWNKVSAGPPPELDLLDPQLEEPDLIMIASDSAIIPDIVVISEDTVSASDSGQIAEVVVILTVWLSDGSNPDDKISLARLHSAHPDLETTERKDPDGNTYLTAGTFTDYNEARRYLNGTIQPFLQGAKVIALQNDIVIPLMDAIRLLKQ